MRMSEQIVQFLTMKKKSQNWKLNGISKALLFVFLLLLYIKPTGSFGFFGLPRKLLSNIVSNSFIPQRIRDNNNANRLLRKAGRLNEKTDVEDLKPACTTEDRLIDEQETIVDNPGQTTFASIVSPILENEIRRGVPAETIKGAALAGASLALLASKGIVMTSVSALSAAYVAINKGTAGDVFRTVGDIAWDVSDSTAKLIRMATTKDASVKDELSVKLAAKVRRAILSSEYRDVPPTLKSRRVADDASSQEVKAASEPPMGPQEELAKVLFEAENAIDAADAAIAEANETLESDEHISMAVESNKIGSGAEINFEKEAIDLPLELETSRNLEDEIDVSKIFEDKEGSENYSYDDDDDEWLSAVALAQEGLGGTIVGLDDAISDDAAKADWNAAEMLAEALRQSNTTVVQSNTDDEGFEQVLDLDLLRGEARQAVEMDRADMDLSDKETSNFSDFDYAVVDQELVDSDQAQGMAGEVFVDDDLGETFVSDARYPENSDGGNLGDQYLETQYITESLAETSTGESNAFDSSESVYSIQDPDTFFEEGFDFDPSNEDIHAIAAEEPTSDSDLNAADSLLPDGDLEAIAVAARYAVEVAKEENQYKNDFEDLDRFDDVRSTKRKQASSTSQDWSSLTVASLKEALKLRGLKYSGKKSELVAKLEEYEIEMANQSIGGNALVSLSTDLTEQGNSDNGTSTSESDGKPSIKEQDQDFSNSDISKMTVPQLKEELRKRGLKVSGKKVELMERLQQGNMD